MTYAKDNTNPNGSGGSIRTGASLAAQVTAASRPPVSLTPIRAIASASTSASETGSGRSVPALPVPPAPPVEPTLLPPSPTPPPAITLPEISQRFHALVLADRRIAGEMAYWAFRLWQANDWERLGVTDEEEWAERQGLTWGQWKELVTLGDRLQHLSLPEIQSLRRSGMKALLKVHPALWNEYAWIEEAKLLPTREFMMLVVQRNQEHGLSLSSPAEPSSELALRVPLSQRPLLERRLETLRRLHRLPTLADALVFSLEQVDRAGELEDTLGEVRREMEELARLYQLTLSESPAEREQRQEDGGRGRQSLTLASLRAQKLTGKVLRVLKQAGVTTEEEEEEDMEDPPSPLTPSPEPSDAS